MWSQSLFGIDVYHLVQWFFIYSLLGWIVESAYMSFCNRSWTNRGFLKGPFCPIYGIGALLAYGVLGRFVGNYPLLFFMGSILATTWEYVTAHLMLFFFGEFWWDYREKPFNYKGMLCLESSIAWGFYTLGFFGFLHQAVTLVVDRYSMSAGVFASWILAAVMAADLLWSIYQEKRKKIRSREDEYFEERTDR